MPEFVCVEPAISFDQSVTTVRGNDSLVFPHVDSCMSVTLLISPDILIGGHAGMMSHITYDMSAAANLTAIIERILKEVGGRTITRAVFVGNNQVDAGPGENWELVTQVDLIRKAAKNQQLACPLINTCATPKGVDVFFDNGPARLRVQKYVFDKARADTAPPKRQTYAYDVPYHAIRDCAVT